MTLIRIVGLVLLAIGVVLLIFGYNASQSLNEQIVEGFTGRFTQRTMGYLIGGIAAMNAADTAGAQNGDPDHVFPDIFRRLPGKFRIDVPARDANRINILQHQAPR